MPGAYSRKCIGTGNFYCNYEPYTEIFTSDEYQKYGMQFKNIGNMEIDISGESL